MEKEIIISKRFRNKSKSIYLYLLEAFNAKVAYQFLVELESKISFVAEHPFVGKPSQKYHSVRGFFMFPYLRIYYRLFDSKIIFLTIFNMKQSELKNKY